MSNFTKTFEIEYRGQWTTINSSQNAFGAFWRLTDERPVEVQELNPLETLINGYVVRQLSPGRMLPGF